ncbi:MAG: putative S-layer protein [Nanoarchaeota archaeon]|nr:putative S-layer protein [Nanoarchaeota archaeon]
MNKNLFMSGVVLVFILLLANAAFGVDSINGDFSITDTSPVTSPAGLPGSTITMSFNLSTTIASKTIGFISTPLIRTGGTETISAPTIATRTVTNTTPLTVSFDIVLPSIMKGTYTGTISAVDSADASNTAQLPYTITVTQVDGLDVLTYDATNVLKISGQEESTQTGTFSIKNTGSNPLLGLIFSHDIVLSDSDGDAITLSFSNPGTINPGATATVTATAVFGNNIDLKTYSGNVTVTGNTATDSFKLSLVVQPEVCSDGIVKDGVRTSSGNAHLSIDIRNPDSGDDIKPGETLDIEVKVKNNDNQNMDVIVEAFLYDLSNNDEIASVESDSVDINDGDTETFELELEIPKSSDLDTGNTYVLYIKAYEDGDEEDNCNEDSVNLDLKREAHDVVVKSITLTPSSVDCGENIEIKVDVENQGTKNEDDVYIIVKNSELGLNLESNKFDLDKFSGSDESATKRFNFLVPLGTLPKDYLIEAIVYFYNDDETNSDFETLKVRTCDGTTSTGGSAPTATLSIATDTQITVTKGLVNLHLVISNSGSRDLIGTLSFTTIGGWADNLIGQAVSLHPGDNNIYLPVNLKGAAPGMNSATVSVRPLRVGDFEEKQFTLNFDIKEGSESTEGVVSGNFDFLKGRSTAFWVIVDLVLIGAALLIIKAAFFSRKPSL